MLWIFKVGEISTNVEIFPSAHSTEKELGTEREYRFETDLAFLGMWYVHYNL